MSKGEATTKERKEAYFSKLIGLIEEYPTILLMGVDNVGSQQMHKIRQMTRGKCVILMGKNTMIRKAIRGQLANSPNLEKILPYIVGNVGLVFTKEDPKEMRDMLEGEKVAAPARAGSMAPIDVFIEPQNTGMGPEKTSFFQALGIATKITKGSIEILNQQHLIKKNERVGPSEAALLTMLKVFPFSYGMVLTKVYDNGTVFGSEVLDVDEEELMKTFLTGIRNIASISMTLNIPTQAMVPHCFVNALKKVLAVGLATEYSFPAADKLKEILADPSKFAAAAPAAAAPAGGKEEAKKAPEPESESEDEGDFSLFD